MQPLKHRILFACGWTALGAGVVGLVVPVLPTIPFVLLAAACFLRSSERWHRWLLTHPVFGPRSRTVSRGAASGRGRRSWRSRRCRRAPLSVCLVVPILAVDVVLVAVAAAVSIYLLSLPTATADGRAPGEDPPGQSPSP